MQHLFSYLVLILLISHKGLSAQNLTAYTDDRGYFYFFNDGEKIKLEHLPVNSYKIGYNAVSYVDSKGNLIVYTKDNKKVDLGSFANFYQPTNHVFAYQQNLSLGTVKNNAKKVLSNDVGAYSVGDSLIAFNDNLIKGFFVYYNGEILQLENNIIEGEVLNFKAEENMLAYFNATGYFKIFKGGVTSEIGRPNNHYEYSVGQNIVAYTNIDNETFNVFEGDYINIIEELLPISFQCGDDMVVYINPFEEFKIYKKGKIQEICASLPDHYLVIDQLVIYANLGRFSIYYNNQNYELENYWVENFKADRNSLAYIDSQGWLIYFHNGVIEKVTNQPITSFSLSGNVLQYSLSTNTYPIIYNEKTW